MASPFPYQNTNHDRGADRTRTYLLPQEPGTSSLVGTLRLAPPQVGSPGTSTLFESQPDPRHCLTTRGGSRIRTGDLLVMSQTGYRSPNPHCSRTFEARSPGSFGQMTLTGPPLRYKPYQGEGCGAQVWTRGSKDTASWPSLRSGGDGEQVSPLTPHTQVLDHGLPLVAEWYFLQQWEVMGVKRCNKPGDRAWVIYLTDTTIL